MLIVCLLGDLQFQLVPNFGYYTILATGLFAVLLCGFMELGQEMYVRSEIAIRVEIIGRLIRVLNLSSENPFNYDLNDLDLDKYCESIQCELLEISTVRIWVSFRSSPRETHELLLYTPSLLKHSKETRSRRRTFTAASTSRLLLTIDVRHKSWWLRTSFPRTSMFPRI